MPLQSIVNRLHPLRLWHRLGGVLRAAAVVAVLAVAGLTAWVMAAGAGVSLDAYGYLDEFDDNNGLHVGNSSNFLNVGGALMATRTTMEVRSNCFALPQPATGRFEGWLYLEATLSATSNVKDNRLHVRSCNKGNATTGGNSLVRVDGLVAGTNVIRLDGIDADETHIQLAWEVEHTVSPTSGGTAARLESWRVQGRASGVTTVTVTPLQTTGIGPSSQIPVRVDVASTGGLTRNAMLRIPMGEINGLSATGAATAPDDGLVSDAERDYGTGAGLVLYRALSMLGYNAASNGAAAVNAMTAGNTAGELRYALGDLASGSSASVNLTLLVPPGTMRNQTLAMRAHVDHGAQPAQPVSGLNTAMTASHTTPTLTTTAGVETWGLTGWGPANAVGPGQTGIYYGFRPMHTNYRSPNSADADRVEVKITFNTGSCVPIYTGYRIWGNFSGSLPVRVISAPTVNTPATTPLIIQTDRLPYNSYTDSNMWRVEPLFNIPASCTDGTQVKLDGSFAYNSSQVVATHSKVLPVVVNYCRRIGSFGASPLRLTNGPTTTFEPWPGWSEYQINGGSIKAGEYFGWALYGSDTLATQTVVLDRTFVAMTVPAWATFHGLAQVNNTTRIYKDSTGTAPLPTGAGFVPTADPPHPAWRPVTATDINTSPFTATPNDSNPSAVVLPGTRLLVMRTNDSPSTVAPDYGNFRPVLTLRVADGSYGVVEAPEGTRYDNPINPRVYTWETKSSPAGTMRDCGASNTLLGATVFKESVSWPMVGETHGTSAPAGGAFGIYVWPRNHRLASSSVKGKWVVNFFASRLQVDLAGITSTITNGTVPPGGSTAGIVFTPPQPQACRAATSADDPACMAVWTVPDNTQPAPGYGTGNQSTATSDMDNLPQYPMFVLSVPILRNVPAGSLVSYTAEVRRTDLSARGADNAVTVSRHAASHYAATGQTTVLESPSVNAALSAPANWPRNSSFSYQWSLSNDGNAPTNGFYTVMRLPRQGTGASQFTPTFKRLYVSEVDGLVQAETSNSGACFGAPTAGTWTAVAMQATSRAGFVRESVADLPADTTCVRLRRNPTGPYTYLAGNVIRAAVDAAIANTASLDGKLLSARALGGSNTAWGSSSSFGPTETADANTTVSSSVITGGDKTAAPDLSRAGWVKWTLRYRNRSGAAASNVQVTEQLPATLIYRGLAGSLPTGLSCTTAGCPVNSAAGDGSGGQVAFVAASLAPNDGDDFGGADQGFVQLWTQVKPGTADGTALTNCVQTSPGTSGVGSNSCTTLSTGRVTAVLTQTVMPAQTGSPPPVFPNDVLRYAVTLTNTGSSAAFLRVYDALPAHTAYVPGSLVVNGSGASDSYFSSGTALSFVSATSVAAGATLTIQYDLRVSAAAPNAADIFNDLVVTPCSDNLSEASCATGKQSNTVHARVKASGAVSGTVFEDVNYGGGSGRSLQASSGVGRPNARVELYNPSGALVAATTTNASGVYTFSDLSPVTYTVRVVNSTVVSSRGGGAAGHWPVQTWRTTADSGAAVGDSERVGGEAPERTDAGPNASGANLASLVTATTVAQSVAAVKITTGTVSGVDFGFNFSTIVNANDDGQGSLRQWVLQASSLGSQSTLVQAGFRRTTSGARAVLPAGAETTIFMVPSGAATPGLRAGLFSPLSSGVVPIALSRGLSLGVHNVNVDGTTQTHNVGDTNPVWLGSGGTVGVSGISLPKVAGPEIKLLKASNATVQYGLTVSGKDSAVRGLGIHGFGQGSSGGDLSASGANALVEGNVVGSHATSLSKPEGAQISLGEAGILFQGVNGVVQNNLVAYGSTRGIYFSSGATGSMAMFNEVLHNGRASTGSNNGGITAANAHSVRIHANRVVDNGASGLTLHADAGSITENTFSGNGYSSSNVSDTMGVLVFGSGHRISGNVIGGNKGAGIAVQAASANATISANAISGNGGLGIDLDTAGVNPNDGAVDSGKANSLIDFPVFSVAQVSGNVAFVSGFVGSAAGQTRFANVRVEVFLADGAAGEHGEGRTYLGHVTTGADGRFAGSMALPAGVSAAPGQVLTGTSTDSGGSTSEFSANVAAAAGNWAISGTVFEDMNYGGGAGRSRAGSNGPAVTGATVELYDANGVYIKATTTGTAGDYSFTELSPGERYFVRVVGSTVMSTRAGSSAGLRGVLTYRGDASSGSVVAVVNAVGGTDPAAPEAGAAGSGAAFSTGSLLFINGPTGTAQAVAPVLMTTSGIMGLDFGFNFNTVVNTNDADAGSLRQVITNANALGADAALAVSGRSAGVEHVVFMLPNGSDAPGLRSAYNAFTTPAGPHRVATLTLAAQLPDITSPLVVDAQQQPGWVLAPLFEINANGHSFGIRLMGGSSVLRGIVLNNLHGGRSGSGILVDNQGGNTIQGNYVGTAADGVGGVRSGCQLIDVYTAGNLIGGSTPAARNVVGLGGCNNIVLRADANVVQGNYVGTGADGATVLSAADNNIVLVGGATRAVIGGSLPGQGNVLNGRGPISIQHGSASGAVIRGNTIGMDAARSTVIRGITATQVYTVAPDTTIGGTGAGDGNVIAGSAGVGVGVTDVQNVAILGNSIFSNATLGIDLRLDGASANDGARTAGAANRLMDHPVFNRLEALGRQLAVGGYVGSAPGQSLFGGARVEVFVSDGAAGTPGQGKTYLGAVTADASGNFTGTLTLPPGLSLAGSSTAITGTATDASGNTSEFSVATRPSYAFVVNHNGDDDDASPGDGVCSTAADAGRCTLRAALAESNEMAAHKVIRFALPNCPGAGCTISPASALPRMTKPVHIAGQSQPGWTLAPLVELDGSAAGAGISGLTFWAGSGSGAGAQVNGLVINRFRYNGINISTAGTVTIQGNYIGTNSAGTASSGLGENGIYVSSGSGHLIGGPLPEQRNVISGNPRRGIELDAGTSGVLIQGNYIGTNAAGTAALANGYNGIHIHDAPGTVIGGAGSLGNVISGNVFNGVVIQGYSNPDLGTVISGNRIGTNAAGTAALPNTGNGVTIDRANNNTVGGQLGVSGNVISGNQYAVAYAAGVSLQNGATGNVVKGNLIGTDISGNSAIGNANGVTTYQAGGNTIGGPTAADRNIISGNGGDGVSLTGRAAAGNTVWGNYIGLNRAGTAGVGNLGHGVWLYDTTLNTLGGAAPGQGNVVSGNRASGIGLGPGANSNTVQGNIVGLDAVAAVAIANGVHGIDVPGGSGNQIGGTTGGAGNVVSGNGMWGVVLDGRNTSGLGSNNAVQGNVIGMDGSKTVARPNVGGGVFVWQQARSNLLGGTAAGAGNLIRGNPTGVATDSSAATGNAILGNAIWGNGGLGIDLQSDGVTANDGQLTTARPNQLMDHPVFTSARARGRELAVTGYVGSAANQSRFAGSRVEVFASDGGAGSHGQGRTYLGALTADANGNFSTTLTLPVPQLKLGTALTGTATDGGNNTSEFGANFAGLVVDLVVNSNTDEHDLSAGDGYCLTASGVCTLRAALQETMSGLGGQTLRFDLPDCPGAGCKIQPTAGLPHVWKSLGIDGRSQPGWRGTPLVWLDGSLAGDVDGLGFDTAGVKGSVVQGLSITGYGGNNGRAIVLHNTAVGVTIKGNWLGLAPDGVSVVRNRVGVDGLSGAGGDHRLGGPDAGEGNRIAGGDFGLVVMGNGNVTQGNVLGLAADGVTPVQAPHYGIAMWGGRGGLIGGTSPGEGNTVVGSGDKGIWLHTGTTRVSVLGNSLSGNRYMGIDLDGNGVTANDGVYDSSRANEGMDHPVLGGAGISTGGDALTVYGTVGTGAGQAAFAGARVEVFKASVSRSGHGDGRVYLGHVVADASGRFAGTLAVAPGSVAEGEVLTATATDTSGNTSEFGPNRAVVPTAALVPGRFDAFDATTVAGSRSGRLVSKVAGAAAGVAVIALDNSGTALHPGFTGDVALTWLDARDDSGAVSGSCRASWVPLGAAGTARFEGNNRVELNVVPPASGTRVMRLRMSYSAGGSNVVACSGDAFAALPARLAWLGASDADAATAGTARSLNNTAVDGGVVHRAGRPFTLRAQALDAGGALMTGYDGSPVVSVASCLLPAGCTAAALTAHSVAAVAGNYLHSAVSYAEVGAVRLQLQDNAYGAVDTADTAAAARTLLSQGLDVGRFVPDRYVLSSSTLGQLNTANASCLASGYGATFLGQPFNWATTPQVTVTALNAGGATTTYWTGTLMKLARGSTSSTLAVSAAGSAALSASYGAIGVTDLGAGQTRLAVSMLDRFVLDLASGAQDSVTPGWTWTLQTNDPSEAAVAGNPTLAASISQSPGFNSGGVFHSGRLTLQPAHGDTRVGPRSLVQLQRFSSAGWVTMTEDRGCVTITRAHVGVSSPTGVFATLGACAAPLTNTATTRGGRAWLVFPPTPGGSPGRLALRLNGAAAAGQSCSGPGAAQAATALPPSWLLGGPAGAGPSALATWGRPQRDATLRREIW